MKAIKASLGAAPECGAVGIFWGGGSEVIVKKPSCSVLGLTLESHRFTRPAACARLPQASAEAKQRDVGSVWPITAHGLNRRGREKSVRSGLRVRHKTFISDGRIPHGERDARLM